MRGYKLHMPRTQTIAAEDRPPLMELMTSRVLASIAAVSRDTVLCGQAVPSRETHQRRFPRVTFYGDQPLRGGLLAHAHERLELAVVLRGTLHMGIGGRIYRLRDGDWCVFPPGVPHGECAVAQRAAYDLLWFVALGDGLELHLTGYRPDAGYRAVHASVLRGMPAGVVARLAELGREPAAPPHAQRRRLLAVAAWCAERLETSGAIADPARVVHPGLERARRLIEDATPAAPGVAQLARTVGLSPNYLSTRFHQHFGRTIRRFIEERRIGLACGYLRQSAMTVKEIAYALRFADPAHFSHAFRRVMGISPLAYRGRASEIQTSPAEDRDIVPGRPAAYDARPNRS